jgi:hypothetical protein
MHIFLDPTRTQDSLTSPDISLETQAGMTSCLSLLQDTHLQLEDYGNNDELVKFNSIKDKYCVKDPITHLPRVFQFHESMISQAAVEDGAARGQKEAYITHIFEKQKKQPNAKNQDPLEVTVVWEDDKDYTHTPEEFVEWYDRETNNGRRPMAGKEFHTKCWAHQHLFESRRRCAAYFKGREDLELSFTWHLCYVSVGLPEAVQSELSVLHNYIDHDVNKSDMIDIIMKIRINWEAHDCFDSRRTNDPKIKNIKHAILKSVGFKDANSGSNAWIIATSAKTFFDEIVILAENHLHGILKGQKTNRAKGGASKKQKVGNAGQASSIDWHQTFSDTQVGAPLPHDVYKAVAWVKHTADADNIVMLMKQVNALVLDLKTFVERVKTYKNMKFLRLQIRNQVRMLAFPITRIFLLSVVIFKMLIFEKSC